MKIVQEFSITSDIGFQILVPHVQKKINYYYEPTKVLHKFDEVSVILRVHGESHTVIIDSIQVVVCNLYHSLQRTLLHKRPLPSCVPVGFLNAALSDDNYKNCWQDDGSPRKESVDYQQFWLWSTSNGMQSWMYNHDEAIYLEIGRTYIIPEDQEQPDDDDFQNYMAHYKPLLVTEIPHKIAQDWLEKCGQIIREIDSADELTI